MPTEKYIIELTLAAREKLMNALLDLKRDNMAELTRAIARGDTGPDLDRMIIWDQDLQQLFMLALYAHKKEGGVTIAK